ncbi:hypothetical protein AAHC03_01267 [Spirometra sp. Aus1]
MLNFNEPTRTDDPQWKILIYDRVGQDIIAPLFTVKELRTLGVTLHMLLDTKREAIPDVPAVYFIYPSQENIRRVCKDFESDLYDSYYLNFISPIPREQLEILAENALAEDCISRIKKVYDQYAKFVCLEDDLFVLTEESRNVQDGTFYTLNKMNSSEAEIQSTVSSVVESLFSLFATLGSVPIIRCSRTNAAEMVSRELDARFRDCLRDSRNTLFAGGDHRTFAGPRNSNTQSAAPRFTFQRPLLVVLDRGLDLATPLHHAWTYQSLVHDLVGIHLNHVDLAPQKPSDGDNSTAKTKRYDFSTSSDRLWREHRTSPFSEVAGALQEELAVLQDREQKLGALKASVSGNGAEEVLPLTDTTSALSSTINTLPQLMEQKRCLDMHMHIATSLAREIKARQLDLLNDVEEKLLSQQTLQDHSVPELLKMEAFTPEDKLRLLLLAALSTSSAPSSAAGGGNSSSAGTVGGGSSTSSSASSTFCLSSTDLDQLTEQLSSLHPELDVSAVKYVHYLRRMAKLSQACTSASDPTKFSSGRGMLNKLVSHGSAMLLEGMRSLVGRKSYLPFTEIVAQLVENKTEMEEYGYFDPKLLRRTESNIPRSKQPFFDVFVFVVGGGTYAEYHNLLDWSRSGSKQPGMPSNSSSSSLNALGLTLSSSAASMADFVSSPTTASSRRITYGGTEILTPKGFLAQLTHLGNEV